MNNPACDCWYLTGATASGKTTVGLELAAALDAEIVSLDSMTIYRDMTIGTAKPTERQRASIPHHLIDILEPTEEYSLAQYVEAANNSIEEIHQRGKNVVFVGGTPLYLKALLRGIFDGPPADWQFRKAVEAEAREVGLEALHERLKQVDPLTAAKLHPGDVRRIVRALEVHKMTGEPISHLQLQFDEEAEAESRRVFVLDWPRARLHRRIEQRVDRMLTVGLVDEVQMLMDKYVALSRTASQAVGYREVLEYLDGSSSLEQTVDRIKTRTRRFAKRQETWFRGLSECRRIPMDDDTGPSRIVEMILRLG